MTLLEWLDRYPPCLCRLAAREGQGNGQRRLTHEDIAKRSGLSRSQVGLLSTRTTWRKIPPETIDAFTKGCGVSHFSLHYEFHSLRDPRNKFFYLRKLKGPALRLYAKIQKLLKERANAKRAQSGSVGSSLVSPPSA